MSRQSKIGSLASGTPLGTKLAAAAVAEGISIDKTELAQGLDTVFAHISVNGELSDAHLDALRTA